MQFIRRLRRVAKQWSENEIKNAIEDMKRRCTEPKVGCLVRARRSDIEVASFLFNNFLSSVFVAAPFLDAPCSHSFVNKTLS